MTTELKPLVLYHAKCLDGIAAAWVFHNLDPNGYEYLAVEYQQAPPDVTDREVFILDFSYPHPVMLEIASKAKSIVVVDHHSGAKKDLEDLPANVTVHYNENYSGSILTYLLFNKHVKSVDKEYASNRKHAPVFIRHIDDGDRYVFEMQNTKKFQAGLIYRDVLLESNRDNTFELFDDLNLLQKGDMVGCSYDSIYRDGEFLLGVEAKETRYQVENSKRYCIVEGYRVPVANISHKLRNQAADLMNENEAFSVTYHDIIKYREFSLRTKNKDIDLALIAKQYGGGGHRSAAGFRIKLSNPLSWAFLQSSE